MAILWEGIRKMIITMTLSYLLIKLNKRISWRILAVLIICSTVISFFSSLLYPLLKYYIMKDYLWNTIPLSFPFYSIIIHTMIPETWCSNMYFLNIPVWGYFFDMYSPGPPFLFLFYLSVNLLGVLFGCLLALMKEIKANIDMNALLFFSLLLLRLPAFILFIKGAYELIWGDIHIYYSQFLDELYSIALFFIFGLPYIFFSVIHIRMKISE